MRIGIYARKSVYSDKSDSIDAQIKICSEYANNNYVIDTATIYSDEGYTGANVKRPDFNRLMDDVANKRIDILICYKIDRISRNVLDFSKVFSILQDSHIEFVSVKEQIDTSTPLGRAMMYICSVFAQMERETTAERVKDNMIELAKSGKWAGGQAPLGFSLNRIIVNDKKHTILKPNPDELLLLNRIFDTFIQGYSLNGLEKKFSKLNVKSKNGGFFSSSQLHQILKNPHYVASDPEVYDYFSSMGCTMASDRSEYDGKHGIVAYGRTYGGRGKPHIVNPPEKWIIAIGKHEPLISSEKWLAAQNRFGINVINKTRKHQIGILKGIVRCKCGYMLRTKHKEDKIYHKVYDDYFCPNRERRGINYCDMKMIGISDIDEAFIEKLKAIKADKSLLLKYIKQDKSETINRSKESILKDIASTKKRIGNLTLAIQENSSSSAVKYLIAEIESADKDIIGYNYELKEAELRNQERSLKAATVDTVYNEICEYIDNFETADYDSQINLLKKIVKECVWTGEQLLVTF